MQSRTMRLASSVLTAGLLLTSVATYYLPQSMNSMVIYAGENDFSWKEYEKKDTSWWISSETISIADEIVKYQL